MHSLRLSIGRTLVAVLTLLVLSVGSLAAPTAEDFGKSPNFSDAKISPGGSHVAAIQWVDGEPRLVMYNLNPAKGEQAIRAISLNVDKETEIKVDGIEWLNDRRVGVFVSFEGEFWRTDVIHTRLMSVPSDLSELRLIPEQNVTGSHGQSQIQTNILDYLPDEPNHILMAMDLTGLGWEVNVYKVNVNNGRTKRVEAADGQVYSYQMDRQGRVRMKTVVKHKTWRVLYRQSDSRSWKILAEADHGESFEFDPVGFTNDPDIIYVNRLNSKGMKEIYTLDLRTQALGEKVYIADGVAGGGLRVDPFTRQVIGFSYVEHFATHAYIDEEFIFIQNSLDAAFPKTQNYITSWNRDRTKFIIFTTSPRHPGTYYLYDRSKGQVRYLLDQYEYKFKESDLSDVTPVTYEARDGWEIPGYLTLPDGHGARPMVVMPHGGPTARDFIRYDYWAQLLASRGYAVLQPNFRGSSGYGEKFQKAGRGEWGLKMQDDITDGVQAMIDRGIADPNRICIFGWSYGGYAALMGAVKTPDLYKCAVSGAPVTDIPLILREGAPGRFAKRNPPNVGNYWKDRGLLRDNSPINNVDAIKIPILLIHGDKDLSVDVGHSKRMAAELKKKGVPTRLVILKDGNHHLSLERNRIRMLKELEAFLGKHLGS